MNKILLAMIALLFALTAAPVVYAEDTDEIATDDSISQELPPLSDPAATDESSSGE